MATYEIVPGPTCIGCLEEIETPNECDMELFRIGVHVHNNEECLNKVDEVLTKRGLYVGEA